jgi:hypothetical protein
MASKTEYSSEEMSRNNNNNNNTSHSANNLKPISKTTSYEFSKRTASEASNLINMSSSHDSLSENAVSKKNLRTDDMSGAIDDVEIPLKLSGDSDKRKSPVKCENLSLEGHDDNISCFSSGAKEASAFSGSLIENKANRDSFSAPESLDGKSRVETSQVKKEPLESLQTKEVKDNEGGIDRVNSESSKKTCSKLKAITDDNDCSSPAEASNSIKVNQESDKKRASEAVVHDSKESSSQSLHADESDNESDLVEQDVKVCDICGDAGREDLLAVCSRCSDGAEHTYCMRERMVEVPEGDWFCEECKLEEESKNPKEDQSVIADRVDKTQSSGQTGAEKTAPRVKLEAKASELDGKKTSKERISAKVSCKRPAEDLEVSSSSKKQAIESSKDSPRILSPSKIGAISRESSFKSFDRGKVRPANQSNSSNRSIDDTIETVSSPTTGPRSQTSRGSLSKANSFNLSNAKPKLKLTDDVPQKLKSSKEFGHGDTREDSGRMIGKSSSFKSGFSSRLNNNSGESRVKMLSPKDSLIQDLKGVKHTKERSFIERKSSFKSDRPFVSSTASTVKADQKPSRPETSSIASIKATKPSSYSNRRGSDLPSPLGEVKRQLSSAPGSINSLDQKPNLVSPINDSLSTSTTPVDTPRIDSKNPRDAMNKGNKLKAAIEAAMLKKPGIYRKNKTVDQSDDLSVSNTKSEIPSQENLGAIYMRKPIPADDKNEAQAINAGSYKQTVASAVTSVLLKTLAIPELEYVWQGNFEVRSSGKSPNLCAGFQAHLSSCASPRVLEAVNKFPHKIILSEVPRLSTWPLQFQENGVKEDNIALYFFAEDLDSFEKSYKILLEDMMRNDLALKAIIDGVELLIFPSNQLPEHSQRWNMLYYMWGVFRGKRPSSTAPKQLCIPENTPAPVMSLPDNICSTIPIDKDIPIPDVEMSEVHPLPSLPLTKTINGDCDTKVSSFTPKPVCVQSENNEKHGCNNNVPHVQKPSPEERAVNNEHRVETEQVSKPVSEKIPIDLDALPDDDDEQSHSSSPDLNKMPAGNSWQHENRKRPLVDSSADASADEGNSYKKQKTQPNDSYEGSDYKTPLPNLNAMYLFPVGPRQENEVDLNGKSIPYIGISSDDEDKPPNLELALGGETKSLRNSNQKVQPPDKTSEAADAASNDDVTEDVSASLSLSLSFPFPDKDKAVQAVIPERRHLNPSLVLFGSFADK